MSRRSFEVRSGGHLIAYGDDFGVHYASGYGAEDIVDALRCWGETRLAEVPEMEDAVGVYVCAPGVTYTFTNTFLTRRGASVDPLPNPPEGVL